eukprot:943346-Lingulodinium_polyedra.AAC.1
MRVSRPRVHHREEEERRGIPSVVCGRVRARARGTARAVVESERQPAQFELRQGPGQARSSLQAR